MHTRFLAYLLVCFSLFCTPSLYAKNIIVVDSYHASYPWANAERKGFKENINPAYKLTFYEMDTKRIAKHLFAKRADEIWEKISEKKPDIVVTMDDNALKYLGQRVIDEGFPLVFLGVNNNPRTYFRNNRLPDKVAGILERPPLKQNIKLISQLVPVKNHRVLLMMDGGTTSNSIKAYALDGQNMLSVNETLLEVFTTSSYSDWKAKVISLSPDKYDALIIGSYAAVKDSNSQQIPDKDLAEWTSLHSAVPLFTFWQHGAGKGKAMGGIAVSGFDQGANAAEAVNQILSTGVIPYVEVPRHGDLILSESELNRWGVEVPHFIKRRSTIID